MKVKKIYLDGSGSNVIFCIFVLILLKEHRVLIHYWGDDKIGRESVSGSGTVVQTKLKLRTMPSVLRSIEQEVANKPAHVVYKQKIVDDQKGHVAVAAPRNLKQVQNVREKVKNEARLSKDAIINIHGIALDDPGFVHLIITHPDLLIVFGQQEIINYANEIMSLRDPNFYFSYDTTFTLGDFYLSILLVRNITFQTMPALPVLFLLHKKNLSSLPQNFF